MVFNSCFAFSTLFIVTYCQVGILKALLNLKFRVDGLVAQFFARSLIVNFFEIFSFINLTQIVFFFQIFAKLSHSSQFPQLDIC